MRARRESSLLRYKSHKGPKLAGVYACRVPMGMPGARLEDRVLCEDVFLMWHGGRWGYLGSDQNYRGEVVGWMGPLERLHKKIEASDDN